MKDLQSVAKVQGLHPKVSDLFYNFITDAENELGIIIRVVQGFRTFEEQQAIYDQGRTKPGKIVTWSPPGSSYHNYGLAADECPFILNSTTKLNWDYDFSLLKPIAAKYGITWGGDFPKGKKDLDHFENKLGFNWRYLLHKYQMKDFIVGTQFVNI